MNVPVETRVNVTLRVWHEYDAVLETARRASQREFLAPGRAVLFCAVRTAQELEESMCWFMIITKHTMAR